MVESLLLITGGGVLGSLSLWQMESLRHRLVATTAAARAGWRLSRRMVGLLVGTLLACGILLLARAFQLEGMAWVLAAMVAAVVWAAWALMVPRLPKVQEQRRMKAIRLALPAAVAQWRIEAQSRQTLRVMMDRYVAVLRPERAALQAVIQAALTAVATGATRTVSDPRTGQPIREPLLLGDALLQAAQASGCHDLVAVMGILAEADRSSGVASAAGPLERQGLLLERVIKAELDQMIAKRALGLIACAAPAVVAALVLILFVAAAGGTAQW